MNRIHDQLSLPYFNIDNILEFIYIKNNHFRK